MDSPASNPEDPLRAALLREVRALSRALLELRYRGEIEGRMLAWFGFLSARWRELEPVLEEIARSPPGRLSKRRVKRRLSEVEHVDREMVLSLAMGPRALVKPRGDVAPTLRSRLKGYLPMEVVTEEGYLDPDVEENRLARHYWDHLEGDVMWLAEEVGERDQALRRATLRDGATPARARGFLLNHLLLKRLEVLGKRITRMRGDPRLSFLREVGTPDMKKVRLPPGGEPHLLRLLQSYERYRREAPPCPYRLEIQRSPDDEGLYNLWCVLKVLSTLIDLGFKMEEERLIGFEEETIQVGLGRGLLARLQGEGRRVDLHYRRTYDKGGPYGSYSEEVEVPLSLEFFKGTSQVPSILILEPRYDLAYSREVFVERDLLRLHALRDAIVSLSEEPLRRIVEGAYVVHPSRLEVLTYNGLGEIPLRPGGGTEGLRRILRGLLR